MGKRSVIPLDHLENYREIPQKGPIFLFWASKKLNGFQLQESLSRRLTFLSCNETTAFSVLAQIVIGNFISTCNILNIGRTAHYIDMNVLSHVTSCHMPPRRHAHKRAVHVSSYWRDCCQKSSSYVAMLYRLRCFIHRLISPMHCTDV